MSCRRPPFLEMASEMIFALQGTHACHSTKRRCVPYFIVSTTYLASNLAHGCVKGVRRTATRSSSRVLPFTLYPWGGASSLYVQSFFFRLLRLGQGSPSSRHLSLVKIAYATIGSAAVLVSLGYIKTVPPVSDTASRVDKRK